MAAVNEHDQWKMLVEWLSTSYPKPPSPGGGEDYPSVTIERRWSVAQKRRVFVVWIHSNEWSSSWHGCGVGLTVGAALASVEDCGIETCACRKARLFKPTAAVQS